MRLKPVHKKLLWIGAPSLAVLLLLGGAWHWWRSRVVRSQPVVAVADDGRQGPVVRGMPRYNVGVWPPGPPQDTGIGYSHLFPINPQTNYNRVPPGNQYGAGR